MRGRWPKGVLFLGAGNPEGVLVAAAIGLVVVVGAAWFFNATADERARRAAALSRRYGSSFAVAPRTAATIIRAMSLLIVGAAFAAFVLTALR